MDVLIDVTGWVHILSSSFCMAIGLLILLTRKGTSLHKSRGRLYVISMIVICITALFIYRLDVFFFPHWLAIVSLIMIIAGYWLASKKPIKRWKGAHIFCMVVSYYMLVGGAINEAFLHWDYFFQELTVAERFALPSYGILHAMALLVFLILLIVFLVRHRTRANR